jgi:RNA polymerase sigma-70 factor (ECF subfamily)
MNSGVNTWEIDVDVTFSSDRDLVHRFRQGDREAFTAIYRAHSPAVYRFALHMTGDPAKASEITQEVFVWLIHHPQAFNPARGEMGQFLAGVARQFTRRQQRRELRWLPFDGLLRHESADTPDPTRAIDGASIRKAVASLPLRYREPIVLCDLEGHSYEEAAQILNCAVGTIRSRLHRAHDLLARKFQPRKNV